MFKEMYIYSLYCYLLVFIILPPIQKNYNFVWKTRGNPDDDLIKKKKKKKKKNCDIDSGIHSVPKCPSPRQIGLFPLCHLLWHHKKANPQPSLSVVSSEV